MTEQLERRTESTRLQILHAASRQFAQKSYSLVSLDDILDDAQVTKGAMYFHFRSKHALAVEIVEHRATIAAAAMQELIRRGLSGLETAIDLTYQTALEDVREDMARAALNLIESIGRTDGLQSRVIGLWLGMLTDICRRAINDGDVADRHDPEDIAKVMVSMYLGTRQTSDINDPERFFRDLEGIWNLTLPGFTTPDRLSYLTQFTKRRTKLAIRKARPAPADAL